MFIIKSILKLFLEILYINKLLFIMKYSIENIDNVIVFRIKNENINADIAPQLKAKLLILCQPDVESMILDLSMVEYIDSSGLGAILLAYRQMNEYEHQLVLVGVKEVPMKMFKISHLAELFDFYDSVDEALLDLQNS